jgi:hypothetical protein
MHSNDNLPREKSRLTTASRPDDVSFTEIDNELIQKLREEHCDEPLTIPPESVWMQIKSTRTDNVSKIKRTKYQIGYVSRIAASVFFISVGWLVWSNYQLKAELNDALQVNRMLEIQLTQENTATFQQTQLLSEIRLIELRLGEAKTLHEKLSLLREREKVMQVMVFTIKGESYEYSI